MLALSIHEHAEDDIEELWKNCPKAAARITIILQELEGDQDLMDRLTQHDYGKYDKSAPFNISKWFEQYNQDRDIWRLTIWDLEKSGLQYRVIYAFIPNKKHHYILAIAPRDFNYEASHPITNRIIEDYNDL